MYDDYSMYGQPETVGSTGDALIGAWGIGMILGYLVFFAIMQYRIAHKTGNSDIAWWAFVPILNTLLLIQMAGKPLWWFALLLVPFVNAIVFFALWMIAARNAGSNMFWGFWVLIPPFSILALIMIAFGATRYTYPDDTTGTPPPPRPRRQPPEPVIFQ